jgi:hypothetical protein
MKIIIENLALCTDCTMAAVNSDYSGLEYHYPPEESERRMQEITEGLEKLGSGLCYDGTQEEDEFSHRQCDCCGSRLTGRRSFFCVLG